MLRVPVQARVLMVATVAFGTAAVALATVEGGLSSLTTLALFATAVVLTEIFQIEHDERSHDPLDAHISSFSTGVHFATIVVLGPFAAALVAAFGVAAVDPLKGRAWSKVAFNGSVFALACLAAGGVFHLAGGDPGQLTLPGDFLPVAGLVLAYTVVNTVLVGAIIGFSRSRSPWASIVSTLRTEAPAAVAQGALGVLLALCALDQPWAAAALVPLLVAVYHAHARLAQLRRETARALETFANVVDERDPYTFRHSARVAEHVRRLGEALELPDAVVARLHWAGRLHDLGKIAVDASVLRKPTALAPDEWATVWRHPRLSARLLQRFRFASDEARAVEFHHERFDGKGYYGVDPSAIPLAAHFLIVADSYDAMRSDRPYRAGLSRESALAEIEAGSGTQFHPTVAKAFVALERGGDPAATLTADERVELRRLSYRRSNRMVRSTLSRRPDLYALSALSAGLFAFGLGLAVLGLAGVLLAGASICWTRFDRQRGDRLARGLREVVHTQGTANRLFSDVASVLAYSSPLRWAGLLAWREAELDGSVVADWGSRVEAPTQAGLKSWLVREIESTDAVIVADREVGRNGGCAALALRRDGAIVGYLVLVFARAMPRHVELALSRSAGELSDALAERRDEPAEPRRLTAVG